MKKEWTKPELIVLLQGKAEEAVLTHCKAVTVSGDPTLNQGGQLCAYSGKTCHPFRLKVYHFLYGTFSVNNLRPVAVFSRKAC